MPPSPIATSAPLGVTASRLITSVFLMPDSALNDLPFHAPEPAPMKINLSSTSTMSSTLPGVLNFAFFQPVVS